jgi:alkylation response protein AidB-like acyl-CoA dehydrogenase
MLERSAALVPLLEERAGRAELLRRLPDETIADAVRAELFRMVVPKGCGGFGLGLDTLAQVARRLAHGCPSSAWTLTFLAMHNWILAKFGEELQRELFGERPYVLAPAPLAPTGRLKPTRGGYRLSGRWEWATGVMHADWLIVHATERLEHPFVTRFCVVPIEDVSVEDVWYTSGMRATGSNTVKITDTFVPEHRTALGEALLRRGIPKGLDEKEDPFSAYPVLPVLALVAAAPALGAAERCVELFCQRLQERVLAYSMGERQLERPTALARLAEALAVVRAASAAWEAALATVGRACERPEGPTAKELAAVRLAAASTVRMSREVISIVCEGSGASIYYETSPFQRFQRDVEMLKGHVIFDWDRTAELVGRIEAGLAPRPGDML